MIRTKFQSESAQRERLDRVTSPRFNNNRVTKSDSLRSERSRDRSTTATVDPMFLGLLLRGWITQREQQFLDDLAPAQSLSFLISNGKYVHPKDVELFPHELIDTSIEQRNPAIFTHLCPPINRRSSSSYRISTVIINPDEAVPVVFGVFGPEHELTGAEFERRFLRLADSFRSGFKTAREAESRLCEISHAGQPTIIINRASGRVLAANKTAVDRFGVPENVLVDQEFGETRKLLPDLMAGARLRIENINCGDLCLALVITTSSTDSEIDNPTLTRFLTLEIENKLSLLNKSLSDAERDSAENSNTESSECERPAESLTNSIKHDIEKIILLAASDKLEIHNTNLLWELDRAVDTINKLPGRHRVIQINNRAQCLGHRAPRTLITNLFEAVLMAHHAGSTAPINTSIHLLRSVDSASLCVKFKTRRYRSHHDVGLHKNWTACAGRLAEMAGVSMKHVKDERGGNFITEMTIEQKRDL